MLTIKDSGTTLDTLPNQKGKNFSDDQIKANILNNYLISVLTDELELLHSLPTLDTDVKCTLYNIKVLPTVVRT